VKASKIEATLIILALSVLVLSSFLPFYWPNMKRLKASRIIIGTNICITLSTQYLYIGIEM